MSYRSDFFTAVETSPGVYDREYNAAVFANRFAKLFGNGVVVEGGGAITDELQVAVAGSSMDVSISLGYALINGYAFEVYSAAETLTVDAADPTNPRIDRVVLELNLTNDIRAIRPLIIKGTPAGSPSAPTLTRMADIYQLSLAQVLVPAGVSILPGNAVTDERLDDTLCGISNVTVGLGPNGYALADACATPIVVQSNAVANTYQGSMPFEAYTDALKFVFVPLADNTGASTLEITYDGVSLGTKKIVDVTGTQISTADRILARIPYLVEYDSTQDGGNGAFILRENTSVQITDQHLGNSALKVWTGTEAEYTALGSKDSNTLYFCT